MASPLSNKMEGRANKMQGRANKMQGRAIINAYLMHKLLTAFSALLKGLSIYVLHMGYHQYKNATTNTWLKPVLDFQGSTRLLTILSYMTVMQLNMLTMLEPSFRDVQTD